MQSDLLGGHPRDRLSVAFAEDFPVRVPVLPEACLGVGTYIGILNETCKLIVRIGRR